MIILASVIDRGTGWGTGKVELSQELGGVVGEEGSWVGVYPACLPLWPLHTTRLRGLATEACCIP